MDFGKMKNKCNNKRGAICLIAPPSVEAARLNKSRHTINGAWLRYFFKDHKCSGNSVSLQPPAEYIMHPAGGCKETEFPEQ